jgi:hypothetical protein
MLEELHNQMKDINQKKQNKQTFFHSAYGSLSIRSEGRSSFNLNHSI